VGALKELWAALPTGLSVSLPRVVVEELERRASRAGVSVEEYLMDLLVRDLSPSEAAERYLRASMELVERAREELAKGDLRQASERVWGACALAIKAHAARRGRLVASHAELWAYKDEVARELGGWVRAAFLKADSMRKNFYEGLATREDVEDSLRDVERLVSEVARALRA